MPKSSKKCRTLWTCMEMFINARLLLEEEKNSLTQVCGCWLLRLWWWIASKRLFAWEITFKLHKWQVIHSLLLFLALLSAIEEVDGGASCSPTLQQSGHVSGRLMPNHLWSDFFSRLMSRGRATSGFLYSVIKRVPHWRGWHRLTLRPFLVVGCQVNCLIRLIHLQGCPGLSMVLHIL